MKPSQFITLAVLISLVSCGNGGGGGSSGTGAASREMSEAVPGTYYTVLRPVNFQSNGFIPYGSATFTLNSDQLDVNISMDDDQAVPHRGMLHLGTRCPTLKDDSNGDGFIDYDEAMKVVGPGLMPLDGDLNSQTAGAMVIPRGPAMTFKRVASLSKINEDLWSADETPSDNIIKLAQGRGIGFQDRVVLVHGTSQKTAFPASLASHPGEAAHLSLPVVCGVLKKIE